MSFAEKPLNALLSFNILHSSSLFFRTVQFCVTGGVLFLPPEIRWTRLTLSEANSAIGWSPITKGQCPSKPRRTRRNILDISQLARGSRLELPSREHRRCA